MSSPALIAQPTGVPSPSSRGAPSPHGVRGLVHRVAARGISFDVSRSHCVSVLVGACRCASVDRMAAPVTRPRARAGGRASMGAQTYAPGPLRWRAQGAARLRADTATTRRQRARCGNAPATNLRRTPGGPSQGPPPRPRRTFRRAPRRGSREAGQSTQGARAHPIFYRFFQPAPFSKSRGCAAIASAAF